MEVFVIWDTQTYDGLPDLMGIASTEEIAQAYCYTNEFCQYDKMEVDKL